jgi:hypothetical protein
MDRTAQRIAGRAIGGFGALLVAALVLVTPFPAGAQFGVAPGTLPPGLGPPPVPRSPACQQLSKLAHETINHSQEVFKASQRKATSRELCPLLKRFLLALSAQEEFMKGLEESETCSRPDALKQVKDLRSQTSQLSKRACDEAARRPKGYEYCHVCGKMGDWGPLVR